MKGGLAAMMFVPRILDRAGIDIAGRLVLTFVVGEEKGEPGTKALVTSYLPGKGVKANCAEEATPTGLAPPHGQR
jgi:acetylornithine deacetylase/succinyl-diaminopimelate desuccinylase-like protein